ncbi:P-loop containing nucleoside triphosphate hydrolase protein [Cubamyces lactineus]|nr:P-loop containing nucleoside triphosphate hydrolase protein [Cubamyces lactineus]
MGSTKKKTICADPTNTRTDAELIDSLRRAWLLPRDGSSDPAAEAKFSLTSNVSDEGSNYSAGEKQLLALCRALVKNSRIIVLDEATSNVDVETDAKVQRTIQTEFSSSTLLCIAHRLNTIVYYDRILVMDAGKVAEFDTPLNLFDKEDSIFRSLCNEANLSRADILKIRATVQGLTPPASVPASVLASSAASVADVGTEQR